MKSNRDLLKEAIADAKTVKEAAIANAKVALEETFGPLLREKLSAKIAEMDELEEEELEEVEAMKEDEYMEESDDMVAEYDAMEEEDTVDEIDLEELLRELDGLEEDEDAVMEGEGLMNDPKGATAHGNVAEEEGYEDEDADGIEDDEDEEVDLENMTEEDLKDFIEDVIADMIESGQLEGEVEGEEEEYEEEDEEVMEEGIFSKIGSALKGASIDKYLKDTLKMSDADVKDAMAQINAGKFTDEALKQKLKDKFDEIYSYLAKYYDPSQAGTMTKNLKAAIVGGKATPTTFKGGAGAEMSNLGLGETKKMKAELKEALETINTLRSELNEINLLNAKLLYVNKIFRAKNLTEAQKVKVLEAFDKTSTPKEAKLVFETLSEGLKEKKSNINESMIGGASKVAGIAPKKPILEVDNQFARWQVLAGISK